MAWIPLEPSRSNGAKTQQKKPISLTVTGDGKQKSRRVIITIRLHLLPDPPAFLHAGARVTPTMGRNEGNEKHAGYLRIFAAGAEGMNGTHTIQETGGSRRGGQTPSLQVSLQEFKGIAPGSHRFTLPPDDDYEYDDKWIEFRLPDWYQPPPELLSEESTPEAALHAAAIAPETRTKEAASPSHHKPKTEAKKAA